jgi:hypothetical protein
MTEYFPSVTDLTAAEFLSLRLVARNVATVTIPKAHQTRLTELGLIRSMRGKLLVTPNGRMVARG